MSTQADGDGPLLGVKVLVVEDEFLVADDMARAVAGLGGEVVGPFSLAESGLAALDEEEIGLAILDVNLQGERVFALADQLAERKVPFIFATGYDKWVLPPRHRERLRLEKPVTARVLKNAILQVRESRA